jgi:bacterioferritin-associated ferredoxin
MSFQKHPVRACICAGRTFSSLYAEALRTGVTDLETLVCATGAGGGCGFCRPYLQRMLLTGETAFPVLAPLEMGDDLL